MIFKHNFLLQKQKDMYRKEKTSIMSLQKIKEKKLDGPGIEPGTSRLRVRYPPWDGAKIQFDFFQEKW